MNYLVDTNRLTDALRGDETVLIRLESAERIWLPYVTVAELRAGFLGGKQRASNESAFQRFLALPGVGVLYADMETTWCYARLFNYLRTEGTPIPTNDLWIASLANQHDLALLTRDRHFLHLPQINCVS